MTIRFRCPHCGKGFSVSDEWKGRKAKCACGAKIVVPSQSTLPPRRITEHAQMCCPRCGTGNADDAPTCRSCGEPLQGRLAPGPMIAAETSSLAIGSLVLGLYSICAGALTGLPAIILGIVALCKIKAGAGRLQGRSLAIGGIATGFVFAAFGILVAAIIFARTYRPNVASFDSIPQNEKTWVKCSQCEATYQLAKREYFKQVSEAARLNPVQPIAILCEKCQQKSAFRAVKCPKCSGVFFWSEVPNDYADRCPKCKYSETEAKRKARLGRQ